MSTIQFQLQGRHALVTGGAQGIGFEITKSFLQSGATVTVWDYSEQALENAKKELSQFAGRVFFQSVNVTSRESIAAATASLTSPLHCLINNAGITRDKSFAKMQAEDWDF